jgi:hypothetical protein
MFTFYARDNKYTLEKNQTIIQRPQGWAISMIAG